MHPSRDKDRLEGRSILHVQLLMEGAETLQAAGRLKALVLLGVKPSWSLFLKASQRQSGSDLTTVFSPEQQLVSGFLVVLPLVRNEEQLAKFRTRAEQFADGAGADWLEADSTTVDTNTRPTRILMIFIAILLVWRNAPPCNPSQVNVFILLWRDLHKRCENGYKRSVEFITVILV